LWFENSGCEPLHPQVLHPVSHSWGNTPDGLLV
jgi:hypothetical protein